MGGDGAQTHNRGVLQIQAYAPAYDKTQQLTTLKNASYDPAWSPTGEWIAFVSTDSGGDELSVNADGSVTQRLTFNTWEWTDPQAGRRTAAGSSSSPTGIRGAASFGS